MVSFSHRLEVFKGLKVDTVLRNFTVFEYTKDKVSAFIFYLSFCQCSSVNIACKVRLFVAVSMIACFTCFSCSSTSTCFHFIW